MLQRWNSIFYTKVASSWPRCMNRNPRNHPSNSNTHHRNITLCDHGNFRYFPTIHLLLRRHVSGITMVRQNFSGCKIKMQITLYLNTKFPFKCGHPTWLSQNKCHLFIFKYHIIYPLTYSQTFMLSAAVNLWIIALGIGKVNLFP